jgi:FkbM family methyltransferase
VGEFACNARQVWPDCTVVCIEANLEHSKSLEPHGEFHIALLGRETGREVDWYRSKTVYVTGDSMYRENTWAYDDRHVVIERRKTIRLDDLLPGRRFDFAKIDVQGAELDVLLGGEETLSECRHLLVELATVEYNRGAPRPQEVIDLLQRRGYRMVGEGNYTFMGKMLVAVDVLFEKVPTVSQSPESR